MCRVSEPDAEPAGGLGGRRRDQCRRRAAQAIRRRAHRDDPVLGCPHGVASAEKQGRREHGGVCLGAPAGWWIRRKPVELGVPAYPAQETRGKSGVFGCFSLYIDRKSTRLNSSHLGISYALFCLK